MAARTSETLWEVGKVRCSEGEPPEIPEGWEPFAVIVNYYTEIWIRRIKEEGSPSPGH